MTRPTSARVAGIAFLVYIVAGIAPMVRAPGLLVSLVLSFVMCFSALALGVTLYRLTCDQDPDIAMLALICRVGEGILAAMLISPRLALLSVGTAGTDASSPEAAQALRAFVASARGWNVIVSAMFFAVGSTLFSYLFLRGRTIPIALAYLGVVASALLVVGLPLQLAGLLTGAITMIMWLPMLAFEVPLALWLIVKGVAMPARRQAA
jgi:Domain of unknown function (DUF4386)